MLSVARKLLFCACGLLLVIGCNGGGDSGPQKYAISGSVSVDGSPITEGEILFIKLGENGSRAAGAIVEGKYEIPAESGAVPGEQVVEIRAFRKSTRPVSPSPLATPEQIAEGSKEQYLPAKYNTQSELNVQITSGEANEHNFELTTK